MNRVLIDLGFIQIYWYSVAIFLGVLVGIIIAYIEIKRRKLDKDMFENMAFYAILSGFVGARIYYVLFNLDYYLSNPIEIIQVWNGGLAIHGGIIGAVIAIYIYCKKHEWELLEILDICVPALIIGQVIGRWGNFFNSEAHGGIVTREFLENLHLPKFIIDGMFIDGVYYHPTFLYESLLNLICFIVLMILRKNKKIRLGVITGIYFMWYSVIRFFIESLRTDSLMLGSLRMAQVISIVLFIIGLLLVIFSKNKKKYNEENETNKKNKKDKKERDI